MNVILLEKVRNLGDLGQEVNVAAGYARNFLYPKGKATPATEANRAKFQAMRAELEKAALESFEAAKTIANNVATLNLTLSAKASDEGKLFGSVGIREIADALAGAGIKIEKNAIQLPTGPIRLIGDYEIEILLHTDVSTQLKISIIAEK